MTSIPQQFIVEDDANEVIQLLAFSFEIRKNLIANQRLRATIPKVIFEAIPNHIFEELIYDNLLQICENLRENLEIKVKATDHFKLEVIQTGVSK